MILAFALAACAPDVVNAEYEVVDPASLSAPSVSGGASAATADTTTVGRAWFAGPDDGRRVLAGFGAPQIGRWTAPGVEPGMAAGAAVCSQMGAHVCDEAELYTAAEQGDFTGAPTDHTFWALVHTYPLRIGDKFEMANTCGTLTYPTMDKKWGAFGTVSGDGSVEWHYSEQKTYDARCLEDIQYCAGTVPSGYECNVARYIPCCYE